MLETSEKSDLTPLQRAQGLLSERKSHEALQIVNQVLRATPGSWSAHMRMARIREWLGQFDKAVEALDRAGELGAPATAVRESKRRIDTTQALVEKAKSALNQGTAELALEDLQAARKMRSSGIVELHLARALRATGDIGQALELIDGFLAERPRHSLAIRLRTEIGKDLPLPAPGHAKTRETRKKAAASEAKPSRQKKPVSDFDSMLAERIAKIEAALPERARPERMAELRKHIRWIKGQAEKIEDRNWANDVVYAKAAYFLNAPTPKPAIDNYDSDLIAKSVEYGYIIWPRRIRAYIRHGKVLDIGCGFGAFGNGFLVAGAADYVGIDPKMPLDSSAVKNKRKRIKADLGITPRDIMRKCPNIRLINGVVEDLGASEQFDVVALHNVTEHLANIREIIPDIRKLLKPGGRLIYHHHNFYCWNGHHQAPNQPQNYTPGVAEQDRMADWNHIIAAPDMPADHYVNAGLNHIRLNEIKAATERHYALEIWKEIDSPAAVTKRLNHSVLAKIQNFDPTLTKRDLTVNAVLCVATPK
ncbi:class I SAM-dependent methyltransferase [Parasphingopyxis marina]|uniref:Methyltransferase n=1 Tax=Parasphingopyxis marina TaxID=2761622 RepID=A0A842HY73_9SPHN|nr:class I SAM-dependent methyltransferase [Parasphingopyxis marina]MBC2777795.1 methyltransferase [Parasphingopyxis marina]